MNNPTAIMKIKSIIMACICLLPSVAVHAQSSQIFMTNAAAHILYRGHENPIQVSVPDIKPSALVVECDDAVVKKDKNGVTWTVMPKYSAEKVVLKIYNTDNNKKTLLREQVYKVTDYPAPTITLLLTVHKLDENGKSAHASLRLTDLQRIQRKAIVSPAEMANRLSKGDTVTEARTELVAQYPDDAMMATPITISAFTAVVLGEEFRCEGNMFSPQAIEKIKTLKSGDQIRLTDIQAVGADGLSVAVKSCNITLK